MRKEVFLVDLLLGFAQAEICNLKWHGMQRPKEGNIASIADLRNGGMITDTFASCVLRAVLSRAEGLSGEEMKCTVHHLRLQRTALNIASDFTSTAIFFKHFQKCFFGVRKMCLILRTSCGFCHDSLRREAQSEVPVSAPC